MVGVAASAMHHDEVRHLISLPLQTSNFDPDIEAVYEDANTMKAFRFSDIREKDGESLKHQMVAADPQYQLFGAGRHMW